MAGSSARGKRVWHILSLAYTVLYCIVETTTPRLQAQDEKPPANDVTQGRPFQRLLGSMHSTPCLLGGRNDRVACPRTWALVWFLDELELIFDSCFLMCFKAFSCYLGVPHPSMPYLRIIPVERSNLLRNQWIFRRQG